MAVANNKEALGTENKVASPKQADKTKKSAKRSQYKRVIITQVRSTIKREKSQKNAMICLGLGKLHRSVEKELTPAIEGVVKKVAHLIEVRDV